MLKLGVLNLGYLRSLKDLLVSLIKVVLVHLAKLSEVNLKSILPILEEAFKL